MFWRRHAVHDDDLSAYIDGELGGAALRRVETHLASCARCREAVAELRAVSRSLAELPGVQAPRPFVVREADVEAPAPVAGGLLGGLTPVLSGVAAIALVAFVVLAGVDLTSDGTRSDNLGEQFAGESELSGAQYADGAPAADGDVPQPATEPDEEQDAARDSGTEDGAASPDFFSDDDAGRAEDGADLQDEAAVGGEGGSGIRIGMGVAGGVAVLAGAAAIFTWWRRRAPDA